MPYIPDFERPHFDSSIKQLQSVIETPGELTYVLYKICLGYPFNQDTKYQQLAEIMGSLENTKQEFYRRVIAPYEEQKIRENGDVI